MDDDVLRDVTLSMSPNKISQRRGFISALFSDGSSSNEPFVDENEGI